MNKSDLHRHYAAAMNAFRQRSALKSPELGYFLRARDFFRADLASKLDIFASFGKGRRVDFVYDLFLEKETIGDAHEFCNFSFLMFCVYMTYAGSLWNLALDDALADQITHSKKYLNSAFMEIAAKAMSDVELKQYFATNFEPRIFDISLPAEPAYAQTFDLAPVVNVSEFVNNRPVDDGV